LAAIRARLDRVHISGDFRARYFVFPTGGVVGPPNRHPDADIRMRLQFTARAGPNTEAVVRVWAANNAACASDVTGLPIACNNFEVRFGHNYNFSVVGFDYAWLDVRDVLGASFVRLGRQVFTLNGHGPGNFGLLYDSFNPLPSAFLLALPLGFVKTEIADGIRGDWTLGSLLVTAAVFRDAILMPPTGVAPGLGSGPAIDHRMVRIANETLLPGWTLAAAYYQAWQHPNVTGVNVSGGTG
ncbi:MAG: hypothetical protein ACRDIC_16995, partial [bacterium]